MRKKNCFCAKSGKNLGVEKRSFSTGYVGEMTIVEHEIVFVVEGTFRIGSTTDPTLQRTLTAGEFVYIPMGVKVACHAIDHSLLLCVRVIEDVRECDLFLINKSQDLDEDRPRAIYTLNATPIIKSFTKNLIEVTDSGMRCMNYMSTKASELVLLLHYCYTPEECARFFAPVVTPDMDFSEFVRTRYLEFRSVREMATAMGLTTKTFTRQFKKVFNTSPMQWIRKEEARKIYFAICQSNMPIKEIAMEQNFKNLANFSRYCRNTFGQSPTAMREGLKK